MRKAIHIRPRERLLATATSTIKSNYFRFATITLNVMHSELSAPTLFIVDKLSHYHAVELYRSFLFLHSPAKCNGL